MLRAAEISPRGPADRFWRPEPLWPQILPRSSGVVPGAKLRKLFRPPKSIFRGRESLLVLEGGTTWWRPGLPASGADQGLRLTECACWRSRARTGVAAMLMGWGEKSNHRKSALDGLRVDVSLAVSPWQARAEVPPTSLGFSGQSTFSHGTKTAPTDRRLCRE